MAPFMKCKICDSSQVGFTNHNISGKWVFLCRRCAGILTSKPVATKPKPSVRV